MAKIRKPPPQLLLFQGMHTDFVESTLIPALKQLYKLHWGKTRAGAEVLEAAIRQWLDVNLLRLLHDLDFNIHHPAKTEGGNLEEV